MQSSLGGTLETNQAVCRQASGRVPDVPATGTPHVYPAEYGPAAALATTGTHLKRITLFADPALFTGLAEKLFSSPLLPPAASLAFTPGPFTSAQ